MMILATSLLSFGIIVAFIYHKDTSDDSDDTQALRGAQ